MSLKPFATLLILPWLLTACGSPDTESMQAGLQQSGLSAAKARCYSDALAEALDTKAFNEVAAHLAEGQSYDESITHVRRKYGLDFRTHLATAKEALAACDR